MQCHVEGCGRDAPYKSAQLCQKHYFRMRRNGTTGKIAKSRKDRVVTPNGYVRVFHPLHALADKGGYVFEHRYVMWSVVGEHTGPCRICGKPESWSTCHVDHIDEDRKNNAKSNLRILCRGCNVKRGFTQDGQSSRSGRALIEFEGIRMTAHAWARDPRVNVTGKTIRLRKESGMSDYDALFSPKITHNRNSRA